MAPITSAELDNGRLKAVTVGENGVKQSDILVHDATTPDPALHIALIQMSLPDLPVAMGVIRNVEAPVYDAELIRQIDAVQQHRTITCTDDLLRSGNTWEVKKAV